MIQKSMCTKRKGEKEETKEREWFWCCEEVGCDKEERMKKLTVWLCDGDCVFKATFYFGCVGSNSAHADCMVAYL